MKEKKYFNRFIKCLIKAGSNMKSDYFKIIQAGDISAKFRERVYCYDWIEERRISFRIIIFPVFCSPNLD